MQVKLLPDQHIDSLYSSNSDLVVELTKTHVRRLAKHIDPLKEFASHLPSRDSTIWLNLNYKYELSASKVVLDFNRASFEISFKMEWNC